MPKKNSIKKITRAKPKQTDKVKKQRVIKPKTRQTYTREQRGQ